MNDGQPHDVEELGAYAVGALDEDASRAVEEHVAACPSCRAELAELQAVSALLSIVPVEVFEETPVRPAETVPRADPAEPGAPALSLGAQRGDTHHVVSIRRRLGQTGRPRRLYFVPVAAALVIAAVLGVGVLIGRGTVAQAPAANLAQPPPATPSAPALGTKLASVTDPRTGARLTVSVAPAAGWVRINASVAGVPAGERCRLVVVSRTGNREIASSWLVSPQAQKVGTNLDAAALVAPEDVTSVEVETFTGMALVTAAV